MKKFITFLLISLFAVSVFAQERTVSKDLPKGHTYYKYNGTSADTLIYTNQDTIDLIFQVELSDRVTKVAVKSRFDVIAGADTTVAITVSGKNFTDGSYTDIINSTLSSAVSANNTVKVVNTTYTETNVTAAFNLTEAAYNSAVAAHDIPFTNPTAGTADTLEVGTYNIVNAEHVIAAAQQTTTVTPADFSYRYYRVRYIIQGNDSVGTGIKIDEVEFKVYY